MKTRMKTWKIILSTYSLIMHTHIRIHVCVVVYILVCFIVFSFLSSGMLRGSHKTSAAKNSQTDALETVR